MYGINNNIIICFYSWFSIGKTKKKRQREKQCKCYYEWLQKGEWSKNSTNVIIICISNIEIIV